MRKVVAALYVALAVGCAAPPGEKGFAQFDGNPAPATQPAAPASVSAAPNDSVQIVTSPAERVAPAPEQKPTPAAPAPAKVQLVSNSAAPPAPPVPVKPEIERVVAAGDPAPLFRPVVNLSILRYSVPLGAVSGNEAFWKRVDEQAVDALTYDVLFKNGVRVGRAPLVDLNYLMNEMEREGAAKPHTMTYAASGSKLIELPLKEVSQQIIYHFDRRNEMSMRSYNASENVLCVEFEPAHRKAGDVRVSLCPMVRTLRKRLSMTEEGDIAYVSPERYYAMNLRADIPLDGVLILAPSPEALARMSLGNSFLVNAGATGLTEEVLLLIPHAIVRREPDQAAAFPPPDEGGMRESEGQ